MCPESELAKQMCFTPLDATLPDVPNGFGNYCSEYVLDAKIPGLPTSNFSRSILLSKLADTQQLQ